MSPIVRIPADVDMHDRVLGPLTTRQLSILAVTGLLLYAAWLGTREWVPIPVFGALCVPVAASAAMLALGRRDGVSLDRLLLAAIRQRTQARVQVAAPDGVCPAPDWLTARTDAAGSKPVSPAPLQLPAEAITSVGSGIGVTDLRGEGLAVVAACSTVNFALQTPAEQEGLVAVFGRWLHSLTAGVQVLVRTERLDLSAQIAELRARAGGLPDPALEAAAIEHADFLQQLGSHTDLLRRQVLLILREPLTATGPSGGLGGPSAWAVLNWVARGRRRAATAPTGEGSPARKAAEARLIRRLTEAAELLGPAGITVTGLDSGRATAVLAAACNPGTLLPPSARMVAAGDVVTGTGERLADMGRDDFGHTTRARRMRSRNRRDRRRAVGTAPPTAGAFVPESLVIGPRHVEVGGEWVASFAVTGFPREVHPGWLSPLLTYPGRLDVAVHVAPIDPATAADRLRKQLARLESGRFHSAEHGRLSDPLVEVATEDAYDLSDRVARGEGKLFRVGLYLSVHARSEATLADEVAALRALTASLLLDVKHTTYRSVQGWVTASLPMGLDLIGMTRTFDTAALSAAFPFTSPDLPATDPTDLACPAGVLYGFNTGGSQALVHWDRFAEQMHNHNSVILGRSGAGKSYLVKLELLRSLYRGVEVAVIDPEDEYARLATTVSGTYLRLGSGIRLNPFDLPIHTHTDGTRTAPPDALLRRTLFCHTVIAVLLGGEPTPAQRAVIDVGIAAAYQAAGITEDPGTWNGPAPTLRTLREALTAAAHAGDDTAAEVAARLHPYVDGAFNQLFDGPTTVAPEGHLVVFSLRDLPDELKTIGTLLTLDAVWRRVTDAAIRRPRLVVVDEAWLLMQQQAGAQFLFKMAKSARKHWAGLTVATQDTADVLGSDLGKAVVANAATQILLRQAPQAIDEVTRTFDLSGGERQFLLSADRGQGLLSAGTQRVTFQVIASPVEHYLVTSNPAELADYAEHTTGFGPDPSYTDLEPGSLR